MVPTRALPMRAPHLFFDPPTYIAAWPVAYPLPTRVIMKLLALPPELEAEITLQTSIPHLGRHTVQALTWRDDAAIHGPQSLHLVER